MRSAAQRRALPRTKGGLSRLGLNRRLGKSQDSKPRARGGLGSPGSVSSQLVLESRVFPAAQRGGSVLLQGCARTLETLDHPESAHVPGEGGVSAGFLPCFSPGVRFGVNLKFPAVSWVSDGRERVRGRLTLCTPFSFLP